MASKTITISIDDETDVILNKLRDLKHNRSGIICDLLKFYCDNDYRIPRNKPVVAAEKKEESALGD